MNVDLTLSNNLYKKNLQSYLKISEDNIKLIEDQNKNFIERLNDANSNNPDWLDESAHLNNITWLYLNAMYITLYSSFEHFLLKVARKIESGPGRKIQLKHIGGTATLDKYINYIHLVGDLDSADRSKSPWDKVMQFKAVRNLLVHNGGIMQETTDTPLEKHTNFLFLKNHDVIIAGSFGLIRIRNLKLLKSFSDITTKISDNIITEFKAKYFDEVKS
jgi:hypothetical protein